MAILQVSADGSIWIRGAAATVLVLHVAGGLVGIASGAAALAFRKGSPAHRWAGRAFFVAMLTMSGSAAAVAPLMHRPLETLMGLFTFYLVATGWAAIRHRDERFGRFELGAFAVALGLVTANLAFAWQAANEPTGHLGGYPSWGYLILAAIVSVAAASDFGMFLRGDLAGRRRIARHLSRMGFAMLIATSSFFLGQQKVFAPSMRGSPIFFVPVLAVLVLLVFWVIRVRFTNRYNRRAAPT